MVGLQLIARYTGLSLIFTEEVARYSYIWVAFLAMALGEKCRTHFNVTVFTVFLKGRAEAALEFIVDLISAFVFIFLFYWSLHFWPFTHVTKSPAMELPMTIISTSLCVGFFLSFMRRLYHASRHAKQMIKGVNP
jgi:TRAP-type C4-dicarboxylate transport system permease small subunit